MYAGVIGRLTGYLRRGVLYKGGGYFIIVLGGEYFGLTAGGIGLQKDRISESPVRLFFYLCFMIDSHLKIRDGIVVFNLSAKTGIVYTDIRQAAEHVGRSPDGLARGIKRDRIYYVGDYIVYRVEVIGSRRKGNADNFKKNSDG